MKRKKVRRPSEPQMKRRNSPVIQSKLWQAIVIFRPINSINIAAIMTPANSAAVVHKILT